MWKFRRLLTSWTQRKINEWILEKLNEDIQLLNCIKKRKIRYYGHVTRKPIAAWRKTLYRDASVAADQEEGREGDGQRT